MSFLIFVLTPFGQAALPRVSTNMVELLENVKSKSSLLRC